MRHLAAHFGGRLVLAQALIDDLAQQVVVGPGEILHFGDQLGAHPMIDLSRWLKGFTASKQIKAATKATRSAEWRSDRG